MNTDYHPTTWLIWLAATAGAALLTRNPLYLSILIAAAGMVFAVLGRRLAAADVGVRPQTWAPIMRLALAAALLTVLLNGLTSHLGSHVLFTLPRSWTLVGGPITVEAIAFGAATGMGFVALMLAFAAFNSALTPATLLRLAPGFAFQAGVALSIAVSFIPQTLIAWQEIREAQRLRGYRVRGMRDLQPLFTSLLAIGLDRAIQLAESMESRGFGGHLQPVSRLVRLLMGFNTLGGLALLLGGLLLRSFWPAARVGSVLMLCAGAAMLFWALWRQGRRVRRTRYRRWLWRRRDSVVASAMALSLLLLLFLNQSAGAVLVYYPYPPYPLTPSFALIPALLCALPILPALLLPPATRPPVASDQ